MSAKTALVFLAEGAEEMELVITADILRRGTVNVTVAALENTGCVKCSRGIMICPDEALNSVSDVEFDAIVLPGGLGGAKKLAQSEVVGSILKKQEAAGRVIAAICAAPTALKVHGIGFGKTLTSYPSVKDQVLGDAGDVYKYSEDKVVIDGNLITSRGPGTAFDFGLAIVEKLVNKETRDTVAKGMLLL